MSVLIIDYGMGNTGSVKRALEECGASVFISSNPEDIKDATHIVLPGVGSFADGMKNLNNYGWRPPLIKTIREDKIPLIGICLGMHLLADKGYENGETQGLGLIPGEVKRLVSNTSNERIPHVGWNEIVKNGDPILFDHISDHSDFYFVHSYHFAVEHKKNILATTPYCGHFSSAVGKGCVYGVQFHPEKSSHYGFRVLRNFLNII